MLEELTLNNKNWESYKLGEIAEFKNGLNFQKKQKGDTGILIVDVLNMYSNNIYVDMDKFYRVKFKKDISSDHILKKGDILFVRSSLKREGTGWSSLFNGYRETVSFCGFIIRARLNEFICLPEYLIYFLRSQRTRNSIVAMAGQVTISNVTQEMIGKLKILLPPLPEQKKIAEILSTVDLAIEKTDKAIEQSKHLKKSTMDMLLEPKFKDSKSGKNETNKLIKEWQHEYLGNLAKLVRGKFTHRPRNDPKFYGGQFPFIQTGDITESAEIIKKYSQTLNDEGVNISKLFKKGTLVISIAGNIGEVGILGFDAYFPDSIVGIFPNEKIINGYFLFYVLEKLQKYIDASAPRSTQKNINLEILKRIKIFFPALKKQKRIVVYLNEYGQKIKLLRLKKEKLTSIKKGLMNDLLTGQKKVRLES